jgi:hypothetical protein
MTLPRTYWCHAAPPGSLPSSPPPGDWTTNAPGLALDWMRDSVRETFPALDRESFGRAWAWLGDHQGVDVAVRKLRRGRPYSYALNTAAGTYTWTAHLVSVLPLADRCTNPTTTAAAAGRRVLADRR